MPIDHQVIDENMIIVTAFGVVTGEQLSDHVFTLLNLHGVSLQSGYKQIFDATLVEKMEFNQDDMKNISTVVLDHGQDRGNITIAFAATDKTVREMIGYYMSLCEITNVTAKLFESRKEADVWLTST